MENQSKFRVVYDPTYDSTFINVYQSRVRYPNYYPNVQSATWPAWWENSFGIINTPTWASGITTPTMIARPQDLVTGTAYDGTALGGTPQFTLPEAAYRYYENIIKANYFFHSDDLLQTVPPATWNNWTFEGHGKAPAGVTNGSRSTDVNSPSIYNLHSFMEFYPQSRPSPMDRVMISTADTSSLYDKTYKSGVPVNYSGLSHLYGYSTTRAPNSTLYYRDSLLYVDLQDLGTGNRIITLDQLHKEGHKQLHTKISLNYWGNRCYLPSAPPPIGTRLESDLYLIRNTLGEYLVVPIWSIEDSIYWRLPKENEDPTKMPCYQWALVANDNNNIFELYNREFAHVRIERASVSATASKFTISGPYSNASFNQENKRVVGKATSKAQALDADDRGKYKSAHTFVIDLEKTFALGEYSFIRLHENVKQNHLTGYKYIDKDATYTDVYAFKYLHIFAKGDNSRYLSWNGYNDTNDSTLYTTGKDRYDKLFFDLQEMEWGTMDPNLRLRLDSKNVLTNGIATPKVGYREATTYNLYKKLFDKLVAKDHLYTNTSGIVLEPFGYWSNKIDSLKPLVRQAYALFLKDPFRWHPTLKGHYLTVGEHDRYVLADKEYALKPYQKNLGKVFGLFGIPHFYFRETFFDVDAMKDDYFAIVQRTDTVNPTSEAYLNWGGPLYGDLEEYLILKFDTIVAGILMDKIKLNREFSFALLDVNDSYDGRVSIEIRTPAFISENVSAFQLEIDEDPIYRRFHMNEPDPWNRHLEDMPDTLEFHLVNQAEGGLRLYENSGNYLDPPALQDPNTIYGRYGACGGRVYNRDDNGKDYFRDTLGNVISFLGQNNSYQYGQFTNYAIFVDTAYIRRGTGWIKPQYMLVVDPYDPVELGDCDPSTGPYGSPNKRYIIGRYLYNTAQYAKEVKDSVENYDRTWKVTGYNDYTIETGKKGYFYNRNNFNKVQPINESVVRKVNGEAYLHNYKDERLAFSWAIHYGDSLYVLKGAEPAYGGDAYRDPQRLFAKLLADYPGGTNNARYLDFGKLISENKATTNPYLEAYWPEGDQNPDNPIAREYYDFKPYVKGGKIGLHAIINLADNTHKDWVFSMRYIERFSSDFVIESETTDRDTRNGAMIRPGFGGWVKTSNGVPVITRNDMKDNMGQSGGAIFNVKRLQNPVGNEEVNATSSAVTIIGGTGSVAILNAAGKKAVISNILGQTVANVTLTSDNATIAAPAGIVVVTIEGETAAKILVK